MFKKHAILAAAPAARFRLLLIATGFILLLFANSSAADIKAELIDYQAQIYTNAESGLTYLNSLVDTVIPEQHEAYHELWLNKAEAEGLLLRFVDMRASLAKLEALANSPASKNTARYFLLRGILTQNEGKLSDSENHLNKAQSQAKAIGEKNIELHAQVELAYTYSLQDEYEAALKTNHAAYLEAIHNDNTFITALADDVYGAIYGYMEQYEESIRYYQQALEGYRSLGYTQYSASAIFGIATSSRYWKKLDEAIKYFSLYEQVMAYTTNEASKFYGRYGMATTLFEQGNCTKALPALALAINTEGAIDYKAELYKRQAQCWLKENKLAQAKQSLTKAENIFKQLPDLKGTNWDIETQLIGSLIKEAEGDYQAAFELLTSYLNAQTELSAKTYSKQLMATKSNLETQRKDLEIQLLTKNAKVQTLIADNQLKENKQQRLLLIGLSTAVVLVFIFAIVQFRNTQKITALSIRDDLTGLYNRRYIFGRLNEFLSGHTKDRQLSIIVADIDNFKQINDNYGHLAGDTIIKKIAQTSLEAMRITDILGRIGGEEYLFILPRTSPKQCEEIADRLLQLIRNKRFTLPSGQPLKVTISIGICHNTGNSDAKTLFQKADEALYRSKNNGKNRLSICHE